jgi:hypothetical protein
MLREKEDGKYALTNGNEISVIYLANTLRKHFSFSFFLSEKLCMACT